MVGSFLDKPVLMASPPASCQISAPVPCEQVKRLPRPVFAGGGLGQLQTQSTSTLWLQLVSTGRGEERTVSTSILWRYRSLPARHLWPVDLLFHHAIIPRFMFYFKPVLCYAAQA